MKKNSPQPPLWKRGGVKKRRVLIALSGGIDSAVSAYLLIKQGYEVEAAFMKNWSSTAGLLKNKCPWLIDRQDALRVAAFLRIPMHTLDFEKQYKKTVMRYFFDEYKKGRTPNPDVMCNKEIKFKLLYNWAMDRGFDYLATGHYARIGRSEGRKVGRRSVPIYRLERSFDEFKDQTYFIYNIKPEQLPHLLFPIGGMKKTAVRSLARKLKLPNAEKKESMGLCFVGKIRLKDFLEQKLTPKPGPIVLLPSKKPSPQPSPIGRGGQVLLGRHQGLYNYTIGQRQGIKVGGTGPYYVVKKDLKTNTLYVTNNPDDKNLLTKEIQIHSANFLTPPSLPFKKGEETAVSPSFSKEGVGGVKLTGRYRHQGQLVPLTITKIKNDPSRLCDASKRAEADLYRIIFNKPQKAVASGQSLVLYRGKECVGGGIIE